MSDLVAFLTARYDEDEAAAKRAAKKRRGPWRVLGEKLRGIVVGRHQDDLVADTPSVDVADHIARWDPARVLREVEAGRKILAEHGLGHDPCDAHDASLRSIPCNTLLTLAAVYSGHPDYRQDWA